MQFAFSSEKLRDLCEDPDRAEACWGRDAAANIRRRLADLQAAKTISDMIVGQLEFIGHGEGEHVRIRLYQKLCLYIHPNLRDTNVCKNGKINWHRVGRVMISRIEVSND